MAADLQRLLEVLDGTDGRGCGRPLAVRSYSVEDLSRKNDQSLTVRYSTLQMLGEMWLSDIIPALKTPLSSCGCSLARRFGKRPPRTFSVYIENYCVLDDTG